MSTTGATNEATNPSASNQVSGRAITAGVLTIVLLAFALLNLQTVRVHWIFATTHAPLIVVIAACGLVGLMIGWLLARGRAARKATRADGRG